MDIENGTYTYTDSDGQKCRVRIERVSWLSQLRKGDHIAIKRLYGCYWHHAIVGDVETEECIINVIEYSSSAREFLQNVIISSFKNPGKAKVMRGKYRLEDGLHLIKHKNCLSADTVVLNAKRKLGENNYHLSKNNCEHFAMWCKTRILSSEQVEITSKKIFKNTLSLVATATGTYAAKSLMRRAANAVLFEVEFAAYDIYCANKDLRAGRITPEQYKDAIRERIVVGVGSVVGSTAGAAVGQDLIPNPVVGGIVGGLVGRLVGRFCADKLWSAVAKWTMHGLWPLNILCSARAWQIN